MGGFLACISFEDSDSLIDKLASVSGSEFEECLLYYKENYQNKLLISQSEFEDVFGPVLGDSEELFHRLKTGETVDFFEVCALFVMGCDEIVTWKMNALFQLFDFDNSGSIDFNEFVMTMEACLRSVVRIKGKPQPKKSEIMKVAKHMYMSIDIDSSSTLELEEILSWAYVCEEILEFIAKMNKKPSLELCRIRYKRYFDYYQSIFTSKSMMIGIEKYAKLVDIETELRKTEYLSKFNPQEFKDIILSTTDENHAFSREILYNDVFSAIAAFEACDVFKSYILSKSDVRNLISLKRDNIVEYNSAEEVMRQIDLSGKGYVSIENWLVYCCFRTTSQLFSKFGFTLKQAFDAIDIDQNGRISSQEMKEMLDSLFEDLKKNFMTHRSEIDNHIEGLSRESLKNREYIDWVAFKDSYDKIEHDVQELRAFILNNF